MLLTCNAAFYSCKTKTEDNQSSTKNNVKNVKSDKDSSSLSMYDIENENVKSIRLSDDLNEISGIAVTTDGRLFCQGDEDGDIFQIDPNTGTIIKKFYLGGNNLTGSIKGDFEDISIVKDRFFLLESKGRLFEFTEGKEGEHVDYKEYKTVLNKENDVEGLCFDESTNSLLLACKGYPGEGYEKQKAVYSFSLETMTLNDKPRFLIPFKEIKKNTIENEFAPSGIARNPKTGTFFIIAAQGNTILELSKDGKILEQKSLPENLHKQPEGICFLLDNTLLISNEGKNKYAHIVKYPVLNNK